MRHKLYPNIRRMTNAFCIGILCVTVSVLALRLTVFSEMAAAPEGTSSGMVASGEEDGFEINGKIYFAAATAKGDVRITNFSDKNLIKVNIVLADSGESILSTGFINPGASLNSRKMDSPGQTLEEGVYDCIAEISTYDPDDIKSVIGTAEKEVRVYIAQKPAKD